MGNNIECVKKVLTSKELQDIKKAKQLLRNYI